MDLQALWLTVRLATSTTLVLMALGIPLAWWLASTRAFECGTLGPSEPQFDVRARMPSKDQRLNRRRGPRSVSTGNKYRRPEVLGAVTSLV